ncbi:hypothetical protein [Burkholderia pseudomallei]|uniref:hypothetical protein n=1 Tax=Burkholderia pseudomallei TaxID=28450 RepID=UPI00190DDAA2|nr:hypothetical protein [Burkholderia pseudomallei]MBK3336873.1 hypothetical protein [Burkholderia pseudomallei]
MQRWERRLADLAHLLRLCGSSYFEPEVFRLNTNQFLTTARTVTFLIQKDKANISGFEGWYEENVIRAWSGDEVMTWAKNSRNYIEKEGDLDLHSKLWATLIYSYSDSEDISLSCDRTQMLAANVKRLVRFSEKYLPSGVSDAAVLKIERRWVANSLPTHELHHALTYVYSRLYATVASLAKHIGVTLDEGVSEPADINSGTPDNARTQYVKIRGRESSAIRAVKFERDPKYVPPQWMVDLTGTHGEYLIAESLAERVSRCAKFAEGTFNQFGSHLSMLFIFDDNGGVLDLVGPALTDQASKFIFWRSIENRIIYLRGASLVWISEVWLRRHTQWAVDPIRKLPIVGEMLHVIGVDRFGRVEDVQWDIVRNEDGAKPVLAIRDQRNPVERNTPFFLRPAVRAFQNVYATSSK